MLTITGTFILVVVGIMWGIVIYRGAQMEGELPSVESLELPGEGEELPPLTVVVPFRNEEAALERCARSLLEQTHPNLDIVFVNDRSDDGSRVILERLHEEHPDRFRAVHIEELPDGWLGKCNALSVGAEDAKGTHILFTDGDIVFHPEALARTHLYALSEDADQLAVTPSMLADSIGERTMLVVFMTVFLLKFTPGRAVKKNSGKYIGIGAFNMIKTEMYRKIHGHRFLRLQVVDDLALGKLVKYSGGVVRIANGADSVKVKWQESLVGTIKGLEKNAFAAFNYSPLKTCVGITGLLVLYWGPLVGVIFASGITNAVSWVALLLQYLVNIAASTRQGYGVVPALINPIGAIFLAVAVGRSMVVTLRRGGVLWRDTFYPLKKLKEFRL